MPQAASSARRQTPVKRAILQAIRYHAQQRLPFSRRIAGLCQEYLRFYENINWHPESNGECRLMYRLTPIGMQTIFDVGANRARRDRPQGIDVAVAEPFRACQAVIDRSLNPG